MSSISAGIDQYHTMYKISQLNPNYGPRPFFFQPYRMSALASFLSLALLLSSSFVGAVVPVSNTGPVVKLSYGSFQGNAARDLVEFLGMPFAAPPYVSYRIFTCGNNSFESIGNLRFAPPAPPLKFAGVRQATSFGAACPQQATNTSSIPGFGSINISAPVSAEDCRTVTHTFLSSSSIWNHRSFHQCRQTGQYTLGKETASTFCKMPSIDFY